MKSGRAQDFLNNPQSFMEQCLQIIKNNRHALAIDGIKYVKGKSKACFATLAERKTRYYIAIKMPNRNAETMKKAIVTALLKFPGDAVKTITCDRGTEFADWKNIEEQLNCDVYFADPYCAWQKGTNENLNGLLREFYPKGRNLSRVSPTTLKKNLALINARPKKILNYQKPADLFELELKKCCT